MMVEELLVTGETGLMPAHSTLLQEPELDSYTRSIQDSRVTANKLAPMGALLVVLSLLAVPSSRCAEESQPTEYQIKAAFLFNFAKFVQWPAMAFSDATSPLVIGILGENPFHDDLARTVRGKVVDDHPLAVRDIRSLADATNCHILFISASEKNRVEEILDGLKGTSVLTVSEIDRFTEAGGMINFVLEGTKIRFQINNETARKAGLKISSKLLSLSLNPKA